MLQAGEALELKSLFPEYFLTWLFLFVEAGSYINLANPGVITSDEVDETIGDTLQVYRSFDLQFYSAQR